MIIPDKFIILGLIGTIPFLLSWSRLIDGILGFIICGGIYLLISIFFNELGGGDIKLIAVLGLWFGLKITFLTMAMASILTIIPILILKKIAKKRDKVALAPFISFTLLISVILFQINSTTF